VTPDAPAPVLDLDYSLLRKVGRGDHRAFADLLARHQRRVYRLALRLLKNPPEAEDAAQEVFLKVYQNASRYEPTGSVGAWINRITANHCLNRLRSGALSKEVAYDPQEEAFGNPLDSAAADPTPLEALEGREFSQRLQQALDALPENQRQALVLKRFGDFSYQEIGILLNLSDQAVDGLIKRARNNLKKALQDYLT
jgi:RNA polymerase sigma-70 factor (ECF subfamily)